MQAPRALSTQAVSVLAALAAEPTRWRHGYDLGRALDLRSGSLYPILMRLQDRGLLEASWEEPGTGKPPRHLYRLTPTGAQELATVRHGRDRVARQPAHGRLRDA